MSPPGSSLGATVLLPTYRRPAGLKRALAALSVQEDPGTSWDVVVIDNDSPPGAEEAFRAGASALGVPARYVREPATGSAHARNRGIAEATGAIIVMLDDDVVPARDWLRTLLRPILAGRAEGTGGRVELDPSVRRPGWFDDSALGPYLGGWDLGPVERDVDVGRWGEFLVTSNCAFSSEILRASGGFDPELGPRAGVQLVNDDTLLTRRFAAAGGRILWVPEAIVTHDLPSERLRPRYLYKRVYAQGRSDWILDRDLYSTRKFGGIRLTPRWLRVELGRRWKEGIWRRRVAFHLSLDVVRFVGTVREALRLWRATNGKGG